MHDKIVSKSETIYKLMGEVLEVYPTVSIAEFANYLKDIGL